MSQDHPRFPKLLGVRVMGVLREQKEKNCGQTNRSIGYRNCNPQPLADSSARLMYLRVYDSRDSSRQPAPSPSPCYSLTHAHRSIGYRNRNPQPLADSSARLMYLRVYDSRDRSHQPSPSPSLCYSLTHTHRSIYRNHNTQHGL